MTGDVDAPLSLDVAIAHLGSRDTRQPVALASYTAGVLVVDEPRQCTRRNATAITHAVDVELIPTILEISPSKDVHAALRTTELARPLAVRRWQLLLMR